MDQTLGLQFLEQDRSSISAKWKCTYVYMLKSSHSSLFMAYNLSCTTLNVKGLNNARKRRQVFRWLHERRFQVIFLQEVCSSRNLERVRSAEWGGKVVYSHGTKHSSGTLVLFNPSLDVEVENHETDQNGRLIILRAKIDESRFIFTDVYALNDQKMQLKFFETLKLRLRKYADENIIIGGDLNCCLTPEDKQEGRPTDQTQQLMVPFLIYAILSI